MPSKLKIRFVTSGRRMFLLLVRLKISKIGSIDAAAARLNGRETRRSHVKNSLSLRSVLRLMIVPSGWMRSCGVLPTDFGCAERDETRLLKSKPRRGHEQPGVEPVALVAVGVVVLGRQVVGPRVAER